MFLPIINSCQPKCRIQNYIPNTESQIENENKNTEEEKSPIYFISLDKYEDLSVTFRKVIDGMHNSPVPKSNNQMSIWF